jgi:hypothetical protein
VVPARSSRHGHLLARGNHAAVARKIHLSRLFSFPEPPLSTPSVWLMAGMAARAFPLGWLGWRYVERPFRRRGPEAVWPGTRFLAVSAVGLVYFMAVGGAVHLRSCALSPLVTTDTLIDKDAARSASWRALLRNPARAEEMSHFAPRAAGGTVNVLVAGGFPFERHAERAGAAQ